MIVVIWTLVLLVALILYYKQTYTVFSRHGVKQFHPLPVLGDMLMLTLRQEHFADHIERLYNAYPEDRHNMLVVFLLVTAATALVWYLKNTYSKLSRIGIHHLPIVPFFGNIMRGVLRKEHMLENIHRTIDAFPEDRIVGQYELTTPILIIKDPELLKNITIKDFDHFTDRRPFTDENDPIFGRNILALKGEEWKAMRTSLTPMFTSSKIRLMVPFIVDVCDRHIASLKKRIQESENGYIDVEGKVIGRRFGSDVLASCAFGIHVESHSEDNEFYTHALNITSFSVLRMLKTVVSRCFPRIAKLLHVSWPASSQFFRDLVLNTIKHREENNITRNDMIHLLMLVKKGKLTHDLKDTADDSGHTGVEESVSDKKKYEIKWTDNDLVMQTIVFLFASFDTLATSVGFLIYQLAINTEARERLLKEILANEEKCGGKFDYVNIHNLEYLHMFVSECLRYWPPVGFLDRCCVKDYNAGKPYPGAKKDCIIRKGDYIGLPIWAFHRDPKFFPEPDKFDPKRFSEENKHKINPSTYFPFGLGPKSCMGYRFVMYELKIITYQLVLNFKIGPCEKTASQPKLTNQAYDMKIAGGWERLELRNE